MAEATCATEFGTMSREFCEINVRPWGGIARATGLYRMDNDDGNLHE